MSKNNGIKILMKINRASQPKDLQFSERKENTGNFALLKNAYIDRVFMHDAQNHQIFSEINQINSKEEENVIFTLVNWTKDGNIFFNEGENLPQEKFHKEKGVAFLLAESIINNYGSKIQIKILQLPTLSNITGSFAAVDEEGFWQAFQINQIKELFMLVSQNHLNKVMMIILRSSLIKFNLLYYPNQSQNVFAELCNNFHSQKVLVSNHFKFIKPPKFCFVWNIQQSVIPDAMQLTMIIQSGKGDKVVIENAKNQMQKLQITYKRQNQKYRKILNILSKCIDLENAQIDKKSLLYVDCLPTSQKPSDKLKISALRKSQNDDEIQQLQKNVIQLQTQIASIKESHREKIIQQQAILSQKQAQKEKLWKLYQNYINPKVKIDHTTNHNLYWRPSHKKGDRQSEQIQESFHQFTKNNLNSYKNLTKKNLDSKIMNSQIKKNIRFQQQNKNYDECQSKQRRINQIKRQQMMFQIKQVFHMIGQQEKVIEKVLQENNHKLKNTTINQIKDRQKQLLVDHDLIHRCLASNYTQQRYKNWIQQEKSFDKFQKELRQKQTPAQTLTTIREM